MSRHKVPDKEKDAHDNMLRYRYNIGTRNLHEVSVWPETIVANDRTHFKYLNLVLNGSIKVDMIRSNTCGNTYF